MPFPAQSHRWHPLTNGVFVMLHSKSEIVLDMVACISGAVHKAHLSHKALNGWTPKREFLIHSSWEEGGMHIPSKNSRKS